MKFFLVRLILRLRGINIAPPVMVQSKYFSLKTYYLRITNNEIVQNSKSEPKNSHLCVLLANIVKFLWKREDTLFAPTLPHFQLKISAASTFPIFIIVPMQNFSRLYSNPFQVLQGKGMGPSLHALFVSTMQSM